MTETLKKRSKSQCYLIIGILLTLFSTSMISVLLLNNDYGSLNVSTVSIPYEDSRLTGFLYRPTDASEDNKLPIVICAHGVSNSKFTMSGIALEVARRGFVTLSIDLNGHGNSNSVSNDDSTLGILAAINYLSSLPYANSSILGVIGHSMGAGAARATAIAHGNITATVLIGGATSNIANDFNATFPKNLLIAVGEYDEFYSDVNILTTELIDVFGTVVPILPNHAYYGSFAPDSQDARRLVISETIHILEPIDPMIVSETVDWIQNARYIFHFPL
jgi:dienelactone hydrolase